MDLTIPETFRFHRIKVMCPNVCRLTNFSIPVWMLSQKPTTTLRWTKGVDWPKSLKTNPAIFKVHLPSHKFKAVIFRLPRRKTRGKNWTHWTVYPAIPSIRLRSLWQCSIAHHKYVTLHLLISHFWHPMLSVTMSDSNLALIPITPRSIVIKFLVSIRFSNTIFFINSNSRATVWNLCTKAGRRIAPLYQMEWFRAFAQLHPLHPGVVKA